MGKPTNTRSSGCAVTTSNCVVWQGPDLCCINLCHGDTISDVINELAKRICKIFEMLDVQSYDLSELIDKECPPANFVELIQLLIDTVAKVNLGTSVTAGGTTGCPECEMAVAACFQQQYGTVMSMTEYVTAIGVKLCDQQILIQTQNNALAQMQQQISALQAQVNLLIGG
jgi:hypothetical protein